MRLRSLPFVLLAAAVLVAAAPSAPATHARSGGPASARLGDCDVGDLARERRATFVGRMQAVPGTARMSMRFSLFERVADLAPRLVEETGLRSWRRSRPGVRAFEYEQTVAGLSTGSAYRAVVHFRWHGASGRVIKQARRSSGECRQAGDAPNLAVIDVNARAGEASGTQIYGITVVNRGRGTARDVPVDLFVDGAATDAVAISELAPGESRTVRITGPACQQRVRAVVDRADAIAETVEEDNVLRLRCPRVL